MKSKIFTPITEDMFKGSPYAENFKWAVSIDALVGHANLEKLKETYPINPETKVKNLFKPHISRLIKEDEKNKIQNSIIRVPLSSTIFPVRFFYECLNGWNFRTKSDALIELFIDMIAKEEQKIKEREGSLEVKIRDKPTIEEKRMEKRRKKNRITENGVDIRQESFNDFVIERPPVEDKIYVNKITLNEVNIENKNLNWDLIITITESQLEEARRERESTGQDTFITNLPETLDDKKRNLKENPIKNLPNEELSFIGQGNNQIIDNKNSFTTSSSKPKYFQSKQNFFSGRLTGLDEVDETSKYFSFSEDSHSDPLTELNENEVDEILKYFS